MVFRTRQSVGCALGLATVVAFSGACTAPTADTANAGTNTQPAGVSSPLAEFLGTAAWNNQEAFDQAVSEFTLHREELIAQCMNTHGFEYRPDLNSTDFGVRSQALEDAQFSGDREFVIQYGFGIISGHRSFSGGSIWDERDDDPNAELVAALSESERAAYDLALHGPVDNFPVEMNSHADWVNWTNTRGCAGQALVQAQAESILFMQQQDEFEPLFTAINEMWLADREHPDSLAIDSDWANCMAAAGYSHDDGQPQFSMPIEAFNSVWFELVGLQIEMETSMQNVRAALREGTIAEAETMRTHELDLALADLDCRESTDRDARMAAFRQERETQFVADHRPALEAFRDAVAQRENA